MDDADELPTVELAVRGDDVVSERDFRPCGVCERPEWCEPHRECHRIERGLGAICCARVRKGSNGYRATYADCTRRAVVVRDGKPYCRQHDPAAREARQDAAYERLKAAHRQQDWEARVAQAEHAVVAAARLVVRREAPWDVVVDAVAVLDALCEGRGGDDA